MPWGVGPLRREHDQYQEGMYTMGDKGGKKDKAKSQKQKKSKQEQREKRRLEKQPKRAQ
jgi:hypothetical protein